MLVGIVADTHDNVAAVEATVEAFEDRDVHVVVHCGDYIAPLVVPYFEGFELHGVLGNNDGEVQGLHRAFRSLGDDSSLHGRFADLTFGGRRFAVLHGESRTEVDMLARGGDFDYVCYGHHHVAEVREEDGTTVINPGAHFPTVPKEHRSVAVVDTETDEVERISVR